MINIKEDLATWTINYSISTVTQLTKRELGFMERVDRVGRLGHQKVYFLLLFICHLYSI